MNTRLVKSGRLAWPLVVAAVFVTVAIVGFDLIWRTVSLSFEALAMAFGTALVVGAILILVAARLTRTSRQ